MVHERISFPVGHHGFRIVREEGQLRELDPNRPGDSAQARFDELAGIARAYGIRVQQLEPGEHEESPIVPKKIVPQGQTGKKKGKERIMPPNKLRQQKNLRGFTGTWRGQHYEKGRPT